jgi:hypothetical protein
MDQRMVGQTGKSLGRACRATLCLTTTPFHSNSANPMSPARALCFG